MTQKEEAFQPLNMPDLEEIVNEAGEQGLQMTLGGWLFFPQIAIAIGVLTSNRGGGRRTTLAGWTQGAILAC